jgi:SAM-dependent methyltransferase
MSDFGPEHWDERYAAHETVWGAAPNRWVEQEVRDLPPGRALDLACGEGRNALWLDSLGWQVRAVDFSAVAVDKGRGRPSGVEWVVADVTTYSSPAPVDLALLCYLQVPAEDRRAAVRHAAEALAPGGRLLVVAHHTRNRTDGTGGPQRDEVLYTPEDIAADLDGTGLRIDKGTDALRPVDGADRPAIDTLVLATAP